MIWKLPRSGWGARLAAGVLIASTVVLGTASAAFGQAAQGALDITPPPPVPGDLNPPVGSKLFRVGHGVGTQNYICVPSGTGSKFVLFTPQATLFGDDDRQLTTHYFSPNPDEDGNPVRVTWQDSRDTSTVWAKLTKASTDSRFVAEGAVAWLLLERVGSQVGPDGGDTMSGTIAIQRLNTSGGLAPSTGCGSAAEVGNQAFVPYTADYFFYRKAT